MAKKGMVSVRFEGGKELQTALNRLPKTLSKSVLRNAAKEALIPVLKEAETLSEANVKRRTGRFISSWLIGTKLKRSQAREARKSGKTSGVTVYVGSSDPTAHLKEWGWIHHAATPVLRPAWDAKKEEVLHIFGGLVWKQLAKAAQRLAKKAEKGTLSKKTLAFLARSGKR